MEVGKEALRRSLFPQVESWALSFAYAITQSIERSETAVTESIAALFAPRIALSDASCGKVDRVRFAASIWEIASRHAFSGYTTEPFFKLAPAARAAAVLKVKALFTREQIASVLEMHDACQVDELLDAARICFSGGKPWNSSAEVVDATSSRWVTACPAWSNSQTFAAYLGDDLSREQHDRLHQHLVVCVGCRENLAHFKKTYAQWIDWLPAVDVSDDFRGHLDSVATIVAKVHGHKGPSPVPGLRQMMHDRQAQILLGLLMAGFFLHLILKQ